MLQAADVLELLGGFDPGADQRAARSLEMTKVLLRRSPAPFSRHNFDPGHITASGVVLAAARDRVLLVFHGRFRRWLQPGGHVELDDQNLAGTARREIAEETGVQLDPVATPVIVGVDVHPVPARPDEPPHLHHDVVFRFVAAGDGRLAPEAGRPVRWCGVDRLDDYQADAALRASLSRALTGSPSRRS